MDDRGSEVQEARGLSADKLIGQVFHYSAILPFLSPDPQIFPEVWGQVVKRSQDQEVRVTRSGDQDQELLYYLRPGLGQQWYCAN